MTVAIEAEAELGAPEELVEGVARAAERMLEALSLGAAELSIVLVSDPSIRALNAEHRGFDEATDVLAFPMDFADDTGEVAAAPEAERLLGDVVISLPTAQRQAEGAGHSLFAEVRFLLAHGVLHLVGYDHGTPPEKAEMDRETGRLLAAAAPKD